jgi:methylmalonyl-CoA/ethylmalonyl-CoA epimerase
MTSAATNPGLSKIGQIGISVRDLPSMTFFFRDVLGLPLLFEVPGMAFFDCDGVRVMLARPETPELDHPSSILYFKVPNILVAHGSLVDRGVRFDRAPFVVAQMPEYDLWMAFFRDCENNLHALMCEAYR